MPLDLSDGEIQSYLRTAEAPGPMLDLVAMMTGHAVAAGMQLGVFDALGAGSRSADDLAAALPADPRALPVLLDTLVATGYLTRDGQHYATTRLTQQWLRTDSPSGYHRVFQLWYAFVTELWSDLATAVRTGTPRADFYEWLATRPELAADFQRMQAGLAGWLAEEVVACAPVPAGATRLLDLGGGHGGFSDAFCARYPALTATVVDLPEVVARAATQRPATGQVRWRAGDLTAPLPDRDQDVVLLCNVVHGFPPVQARALVAAAVAALRPGGGLFLLETTPPGDLPVGERAFTQCFALHLWHTQGGHVYPEETLASWLREAGTHPPTQQRLTRSGTHVLLTAYRAD